MGFQISKAVDLSSINSIDASSLELLEAAGFGDVEALAGADPLVLHRELAQANGLLHLARENVSKSQVEEWIGQARGLVSEILAPPLIPESDLIEDVVPTEVPVNYERSPEVQVMLASSPFALPLPARVLMDHQVSVSQIPAGIMLNCYVGDLDVRVSQGLPAATEHASGVSSQVLERSRGLNLDISRVRSADELRFQGMRLPGSVSEVQSRQDLMRAPREATNKGRNPESRWFIRGVLHSNPVALYFGALITLCLTMVLPASVLSALLLILSSEVPESFSWVPAWLLAFPIALPLFGFAYLFWGVGGKCRICNQKLFIHRSHLKNAKAHHVPGLGYVIPLCLHLLVFRWFRCTHCGTPARVKE